MSDRDGTGTGTGPQRLAGVVGLPRRARCYRGTHRRGTAVGRRDTRTVWGCVAMAVTAAVGKLFGADRRVSALQAMNSANSQDHGSINTKCQTMANVMGDSFENRRTPSGVDMQWIVAQNWYRKRCGQPAIQRILGGRPRRWQCRHLHTRRTSDACWSGSA